MAKMKKPTADAQANTKTPSDTLSLQGLIGQFAGPAMQRGQQAGMQYQQALNQAAQQAPNNPTLQADIGASMPLVNDTNKLVQDSYRAALASPQYQAVSNALKGLQNVAAYYGLEPSNTGNPQLDAIIGAINTQLRNPTANGSSGMPAIPGLTSLPQPSSSSNG